MAAAGSASIEPKFPCPFISGHRKEKSWKKNNKTTRYSKGKKITTMCVYIHIGMEKQTVDEIENMVINQN